MTKSLCLIAGSVVVLGFAAACSSALPAAPTTANATAPATPLADLASTPVVTLQPNNTASPSSVTVAAGNTVLFSNQSGHAVLLRSYNCSEFSSMGLQNGVSRHTMPFNPAGKTCDYFAFYNAQKVDVGRVVVE